MRRLLLPLVVLLAGAAGCESLRTTPDDVPVAVRVRDLARLNASFLSSPVVSRTDRLRALTAYLGVPPQPGRSWKAWWAAVARATRAKAAKNARTGRPLA